MIPTGKSIDPWVQNRQNRERFERETRLQQADAAWAKALKDAARALLVVEAALGPQMAVRRLLGQAEAGVRQQIHQESMKLK